MAWALTQSGFSRQLADAMTALPGGAPTFMAVSIVAFIVLGCVLEGIPAIVLFGPLLFPIARAGRHPRGALRDGRRSSRWASACSRRRSASATTRPARSAASIPDEGMRPIVGYMVALLVGIDHRRGGAVDLDRLSLKAIASERISTGPAVSCARSRERRAVAQMPAYHS